jgi:protein-L-isoaspartate O-methyltransferase
VTQGATAIPEVQALLRVLAAGRDVAEMGAAYRETAAIMAETAHSVVTVERDPGRLAPVSNVELLEGDVWERLQKRGPFGLVFLDGGLRPVTAEKWDAIREFLLRDSRLAATEFPVAQQMAVIVAAKLG